MSSGTHEITDGEITIYSDTELPLSHELREALDDNSRGESRATEGDGSSGSALTAAAYSW